MATLPIMRDATVRRFMVIAGVTQLVNLLLAALLAIFATWHPSDEWLTLTGLGLASYLFAVFVYCAPR